MQGKGLGRLLGGHVPNFDRVVGRSRGQHIAVLLVPGQSQHGVLMTSWSDRNLGRGRGGALLLALVALLRSSGSCNAICLICSRRLIIGPTERRHRLDGIHHVQVPDLDAWLK